MRVHSTEESAGIKFKSYIIKKNHCNHLYLIDYSDFFYLDFT